MKSIEVVIKKNVTYCHNCPYYYTEQGGPMTCGHKNAPDMGYIISQDDVYKRKTFPQKCPLLKN